MAANVRSRTRTRQAAVVANVRLRGRTRQEAMEEDVRRLVARELHDRVAQTLTGMLIDLENFKTEQVDWTDVLRQMDTIQESTRQVLNNLRQMLHDLRGEESVGGSFINSVGTLLARFEEKTRISAKLTVFPGWPESITQPATVNLYRIIEEALANVKMHSGAREVNIVLRPDSDKEVSVLIRDDGRGVDADDSRKLGFGTVGMKERAILLGGRIRVESKSGEGTSVVGVFPQVNLIANDSQITSMKLETKEISA
jgi:signal transduction histidine kinase